MKGIKNIVTKEQLSSIGNVIKDGAKIIAPILGVVIFSNAGSIAHKVRYSGKVNYGDAVNVIMNSSMWSEDKSKVISFLKTDGDSDFYRSVISVVKSSMWSNDKVKTIEDMNGR